MLGLQGGHEVAMHLGEWLDEDIDFTPAAQADGPGKVVADAVVKQASGLSLQDRLRLLEDLPLETPAADATGDLSGLADRPPRPCGPRGASPGADHGGDRDGIARRQPGLDVIHDVAHDRSVV